MLEKVFFKIKFFILLGIKFLIERTRLFSLNLYLSFEENLIFLSLDNPLFTISSENRDLVYCLSKFKNSTNSPIKFSLFNLKSS